MFESIYFSRFYNLDIVIPPNKPCIRTDHKDLIFRSKKEKKSALIKEIIEVSQNKRPILVGTFSVESADRVIESKNHLPEPHTAEILNTS